MRVPLRALLLLSAALPVLADERVIAEPDPSPEFTSAAVPANRPRPTDAIVDGKDGKPHAGPYVHDHAPDDRADPDDPVGRIGSLGPESGPGDKYTPPPGSLAEKAMKLGPENDGVMLDRGSNQKDGPRGTEGGVSEKNRQAKSQEESGEPIVRKPDSPKQAPPPPASESVDADDADQKPKGAAGLERPTNLPDKPHAIPIPDRPSLSNPSAPQSDERLSPLKDGAIDHSDYRSFILSFTMIIFSEIGDKTFLVAVLMAMRHPKLQFVIFSAAASALVTMTILSSLLGHAVPTLLPQSLTTAIAAVLFFVFGIKMINEGLALDVDEGVGAEMKEVEQELNQKDGAKHPGLLSPDAMEEGNSQFRLSNHTDSSRPSSPVPRSARPGQTSALTGLHNLCSLLLSPVWVQTFVMTFLGEWGDRSQIATVAMASGEDWWWVTAGALAGHLLCTALAVIGGRSIALKVSMRTMTLGGAATFILFGIVSLVEVFRSW